MELGNPEAHFSRERERGVCVWVGGARRPNCLVGCYGNKAMSQTSLGLGADAHMVMQSHGWETV